MLEGLLLGWLFFGGRRCSCEVCVKARKKEETEYQKWLRKRGMSESVSVSLSPSVSSSVSIQEDEN